ncbi:hypothetical protein [Miltoncostaea oceani]|uniref:hypothetical protein n=1 Tax=Miltoncostaea oceani TaxID=2843216 RepID=UPI001C3DEC2A|nr:hypothetical protein [Miltoncostaea oceani]
MATVPRILRLTDGDAVAPDGTRFALLHVVAGERHHLGWFELSGDAWRVGLTSAADVADAGVPAAEVRAATAGVLEALRTARDEDDVDVPPPIGPIVNTLRLVVDRRRAITRLEGELQALDPAP